MRRERYDVKITNYKLQKIGLKFLKLSWARDLVKRDPPDPIPNSEVKAFDADDTPSGGK